MKKILIIVAALVALLVAAVLFVPSFVDWDKFKPQIAAAVKESTGRDLNIKGKISLSIFPAIEFSAGDIHFSNAPGASTPDMVAIGSVSGKLRLWPLLGNRVIIDSFAVSDLAVNLEVDKNGKPNWQFKPEGAPSAKPVAEKPSTQGEDILPVGDISLGDVKIERGELTFFNVGTGQKIDAKDLNLTASLPGLAGPFALAIRLVMNGEPVTVDVSVESPQNLLTGSPTKVKKALSTKHASVTFEATIQQKPVPGLDGVFDLDIPSMGKLAAWLDQPLEASDPGKLKVHAEFGADGAKVALKEAVIEGKGMQAKATGSYDGSGSIAKVVLNVKSGILDVDRYLPPASKTGKAPAAPEKTSSTASGGDPLAALSLEPFELSALKKTEADIQVAMDGIRAMGYKIGKVAFTISLKDGILAADLSDLRLYGGNVKAKVKLDGSGEALGVDAAIDINKVKVDQLSKAATGEKKITGVASGTLKATGSGANPRALVENLKAKLDFDLGGVKAAGALSGAKISLDLPGLESSPSLKGSVVYNKQTVNLDLTLDPIKKVLSGDAFALKAAVVSKLVNTGYEGKIQQKPVPGLDGTFHLNIPSVGRLARWVGQPLPASQPDPGPLNIRAVFKGDGAKVALKEAVIEGKAMKAKVTGSYDGSGKIKKVALNVESGVLNVDRYLPSPAKAKKGVAPQKEMAAPSGDPFAAFSQEPFDLSDLKGTEADVRVAMAGINAMGYKIGKVALSMNLKNGILSTNLSELALYGGKVKGSAKLDGSGKDLGVDANFSIAGVKVGPLLKAATGEKPKVEGIASGNLNLSGKGANARAMAESLRGKLAFGLGGISMKEAKAGSVSEIRANLDLPGMESQSKFTGSAVYNKVRVNLNLNLDPIKKVLSGKSFDVKVALDSKLVSLSYDGSVLQKPEPGLEGKFQLDVGSVGKLAKWVGQPLDASQPDPGPLKIQAEFSSDGAKALLKSATITGKALKVKASGICDRSKAVHVVTAKVDVEQADLDAYLLKPKKGKKSAPAKKRTAKGKSAGWSTETLDLSALSENDVDIQINIKSLKYGELHIKPGRIITTIKNGVLKASIEELKLAEGSIKASATVDASKPTASLNYQVAISSIQARPLLKTLAGNDRLSGTTEFQAKGKARGKNQKELVSSLNGDGSFKFLDGAIHGINLAASLRKAQTLGFGKSGEEQKTDFAELSGSFVIKHGVLDNQDLKMLAPLVRLSGKGIVPMPTQTIDYVATAKLVASLKGQGGSEGLSGLPIPVEVKGPWDNVSYKVDWKSVFTGAAMNPDRLKNMPSALLKKGKGLGVNMGIPKVVPNVGSIGGAAEALKAKLLGGSEPAAGTTTTKKSGGLLGTLKQLGQTKKTAPTQPAPASAPEPSKPKEKPAPLKQLEQPLKSLKGLFGN